MIFVPLFVGIEGLFFYYQNPTILVYKLEERKMADVKIILPDGSAKEYAAGTTLGEAVKQLSNSLAKKVLAANVMVN